MPERPRYRVVLKTGVPFGATASGTVFTREACFALAGEYFDHAEDGNVVAVFTPPDSRDAPDYEWIKGAHSRPTP